MAADDLGSCERCGRELPERKLKEVVYEEGRDRIQMVVCPTCLDQIMNGAVRVRGVVGTQKRAAIHIDRGRGTGGRTSLGERG